MCKRIQKKKKMKLKFKTKSMNKKITYEIEVKGNK